MQSDGMQGFEPEEQPEQKFEGKAGQEELEGQEWGKSARACPWKGCP